MLSFGNFPQRCPGVFLLLVSALLVILVFAGTSDGAPSSISAAKKEETGAASSAGASAAALSSNSDLGRVFQLLADHYYSKREVGPEEEDDLRPAYISYRSMLNKRGNNGGGGDDYGHLRFGRSGGSRIKYNDPDYGHMRFGRK